MARQAKMFIYISEPKKVHQVFIPASRVPRLKYHGIDPEYFTGLEIDVYLATGERNEQGYCQMKYHHTVFPKIQNERG